MAELASLIDPSLAAPFVPVSVFTGLEAAVYWSASTFADDPTAAWFVGFFRDEVFVAAKANTFLVWCVRGGMNADVC